MEEWEINKPLGQCCGTGRKIAYGEEYFAALVETEQGLERRDFCSDYWQSERPEAFCYWRTRLADPREKKQMFIDDEMLMSFFQRLAGETAEEKVNFRFVLALILMRKRHLKYDSSVTEGDKEVWHLRVAGADRFVDVVNPHLTEKQIEQLSSQISVILQVDL